MAGEDLTTKAISLASKGLNGGLNSTASPLTLQNTESSKLLNIDFDKFGSVLKRNGYTNINTVALNSSAQITGLHWLELSSGTKSLVTVAGNKVYSNDLSSTFTDITGAITVTAGNLCRSQTFLDTAMFTNGVDLPFQWTGTGNCTAMTVPAGLTTAKWIRTFNAYTFLANVTDASGYQPSLLYWSNINSISTWTPTDKAFINKNDGQTITGMEVLGDRLVLFKDRSIWIGQFTGDVDIPFQFQKTQSHVGCVSGYSISFVDNGLQFLGEDGIYFFDGNQSTKLSNRITNTLQANNLSKNPNAVSMYQKFKNRYWVSQTTGGVSQANSVITYDNFNDAFSVYSGMAPSMMCVAYSTGTEYPIFGDYSGFVYKADTTSRHDSPLGVSTAIASYFYTKWIDYDDLVNQKGLAQVDVYYQLNPATLQVVYAYDFEEGDTYALSFDTTGGASLYGTAVYGTATYAGTGGAHYRLDLTGRGRVVRFGFKNSSIDETFRIDGLGQLVHLETNQ